MAEVQNGAGDGERSAPLTRRGFIQAVGAVGGTTAAWSALSAFGHIAAAQPTNPPPLDGGGSGKSVLVLGAGPAGMVAGYELMNRGYNVRILEAADRVGGHVFTVRRGRKIQEIGKEEQIVDFDEGQWFDAGAWRIPYMHRGLHHYLREFQIPTVHHTDLNMNAFAYMTGIAGPLADTPVRIRQAVVDMRGYTAELLAAAMNKEQLDEPLTAEERDYFLDYLIDVGLLSRSDLKYGPNEARDWIELDGAAFQRAIPTNPMPLRDILPFAAASGDLTPLGNLLHQPVMMKPAQGMSQLFEEGFQPAVGENLTLNAEVQEIRQTDTGVEVVYLNKETGETMTATADYCYSTIPLSVFIQLPRADISSETREAMYNSSYFPVGKIGLQFKRRFWEEDDWIYGGLTITNVGKIGTISYPTWDYHAPKGVLQAYYVFGDNALDISRRTPQERIEHALEFGSLIHPQFRDEYDGKGYSVNWHLMPYALGGWASWSNYAFQNYFPRLLEPDGRIYFAGDFLSQLAGWIEGAIQASWLQIEKLHQRAVQEA